MDQPRYNPIVPTPEEEKAAASLLKRFTGSGAETSHTPERDSAENRRDER